MKRALVSGLMAWSLASGIACAQDPAPEESRYSTRYSLAVIDDATFYGNASAPIPKILNQVLVEPTFGVKYRRRWSFSSSLVGAETTYSDNVTHMRVKEAYSGLSAGDFDFTVGRKMVRWGAG